MEKNYIKVSALNQYIKLLLDDNSFLHKIYLKGEISNFKNHMSGHLYFTLKDEESRVSAIMFKNNTYELKFTPEDGKKVLIEGRVSCYPAQGTYQIYVEKMEEDGLGNLYILYEELKRKLEKEGLFDARYKKEIPKYPRRIGIVTAPSGAAIRDILSTIKRRYPICETILFPALVQGKSAAPDIVKQINKAQNYPLDLLIVGRGGGSIEDLWAFNEESVARAIFDSQIPIISAVGHEIDYTISDFVADLRAPTPTGAAELSVPTMLEVQNLIDQCNIRIKNSLKKKIEFEEQHLKKLKESYLLQNPNMIYEAKIQKLDYITEEINHWFEKYLENKKNKLMQLETSYVLKNPLFIYQNKQEKIINYQNICSHHMDRILEKYQHQLNFTINTLKLVNPLNILEKGYSILKKDENIIKTSKDLKINDMICVKLREGSIKAIVKEVNHE